MKTQTLDWEKIFVNHTSRLQYLYPKYVKNAQNPTSRKINKEKGLKI